MADLARFPILQNTFLRATVELLKPRVAHCLPLAASLKDAVKSFEMSHAGSVLLLDDENVVKGIVTERDVIGHYTGITSGSIKLPDIATLQVQFVKPKSSIARLLHFISLAGFRHIPVLSDGKDPPRILSLRDVIQFIYERLSKRIVDDSGVVNSDEGIVKRFFNAPISTLASKEVFSLDSEAFLAQAMHIFKEKRAGCIVVSMPGDPIGGIFTERDFVLRVVAKEKTLGTTKLREVATPGPKVLSNGATVAEAFSLMVNGGFRNIPIVRADHKLEGVLTMRNLCEVLTSSILGELERIKS